MRLSGGALLPTRAQAELVAGDDDDEEGAWGGRAMAGGRREEPRSLEEAGPLRVLYEGHDLLIIDKARYCCRCLVAFWVGPHLAIS